MLILIKKQNKMDNKIKLYKCMKITLSKTIW